MSEKPCGAYFFAFFENFFVPILTSGGPASFIMPLQIGKTPIVVLLDSDNEYAYRLKKKVNIVQLTFNSSFAKSLVSMYAFPAKVLKKLSVNFHSVFPP